MTGKSIGTKVLAAHLDLIVGTASRPLNGYADICAATRERIRRAADELGYRPSQSPCHLPIRTPETVGHVLSRNSSSVTETFVAERLQGLGKTLCKRNWDLLGAHADSPKEEPAKVARMVRTGRVAARVLSRPLKNDPWIRLMPNLKCPFLVHRRTASSDDCAWFDIDGEDAFSTAVGHLVGLGHSRIAFVNAPLHFLFIQDRLTGQLIALESNG